MDWQFIHQSLPLYIKAFKLTISIGGIGVVLSLFIGLILAMITFFKIPILSKIIQIYVEISRNTPLLIQLFFIYFGLPKFGIQTNPIVCGIIGLAFLGGGYMTESFRSGLLAIPKIQTESALSLGMAKYQLFVYILLPQALSRSIPSLTANIIFLLKETSVFSAISLMDLMFLTKDLIGIYYKTTESLFMLVIAYLMMLLPVHLLGFFIERRIRYAEFGT